MKTVIEMAKQVLDEGYAPILLHPEIQRLCELVRSDEREACAKFFEEHWRETWTDEQVVEAIRARGQE